MPQWKPSSHPLDERGRTLLASGDVVFGAKICSTCHPGFGEPFLQLMCANFLDQAVLQGMYRVATTESPQSELVYGRFLPLGFYSDECARLSRF